MCSHQWQVVLCLTIGNVTANTAQMLVCHCSAQASCPCSPISVWWDHNDGPSSCCCSHPGCIHQAHTTFPPKQHFLLLHVALAEMWRQSRSLLLDCTPHRLAGQKQTCHHLWWIHLLHKDIHPGSPCSDEREAWPCLPNKCFLCLGGIETWM